MISISSETTRIGAGTFENCASLGQLWITATDCTFIAGSSVYAAVVIYGYSGSMAETYAANYDRTFVEITEAIMTTSATTQTTTTTTTTTTTATTTTTKITMSTTTAMSTTETQTEPTTETTTTATETTTEPELISGFDQDGVCTLKDLVMLNRYLIGSIMQSAADASAMDCYRDGKINVLDNAVLMQFLLR
ncbi:MAG: dockerin type I repeat-containing protein [Ruminococcus sp.]|nr:dockerin type I repeat-containing protein [Ruminococcus sp.]